MLSRQDAVEYETTGPAVVCGGGLIYMLGTKVGLDFSITGAFINWEEQTARVTIGDTVVEGSTSVDGSGGAARFSLGLGYWF